MEQETTAGGDLIDGQSSTDETSGPGRRVIAWTETERTRTLDPLTLAELRTVVQVLEFDVKGWSRKYLEIREHRTVHLKLCGHEDGSWSIMQIVVCNDHGEALVEVFNVHGALLTQRGEAKRFKTLPALLSDVRRIFQYRRGSQAVVALNLDITLLPIDNEPEPVSEDSE